MICICILYAWIIGLSNKICIIEDNWTVIIDSVRYYEVNLVIKDMILPYY